MPPLDSLPRFFRSPPFDIFPRSEDRYIIFKPAFFGSRVCYPPVPVCELPVPLVMFKKMHILYFWV